MRRSINFIKGHSHGHDISHEEWPIVAPASVQSPHITRRSPMIRVRRIAVIAASLGLSLMSGMAYAQSAPAVPGADESAAVTAETAAELTPPTAPTRLTEIKVKGAAAIAARLTRISVLNARVAAVKGDCGDITALQAQLSTDTAGLTALNATLAAETDIIKARAEYRQIYIGFRIYALQSPKTNVVVRCGSSAARIVALRADAAAIQLKITEATTAGRDASASQALVTSATTKFTAAAALATAASNSVIALVPDQGNAAAFAANKVVLGSADAQLKQANAQLDQARAELAAARKALPRPVKTVGARKPAPAATPSTIAA